MVTRFALLAVLVLAFAGSASASHLASPEGALFHNGKIYVSVIGAFGVEDGSIVVVDRQGNTVDTLVQAGDVKDPKGMVVVDKQLWVTDVSAVHRIDLASGAVKATIRLPDAEFANDIAADRKGHVWVSDTRGGALYRITKRGVVNRFRLPAKFASPNGLAFHPKTKELWFVTADGAGRSEVARRTKRGKIRLVKANRAFEGLDGLVFVGRSAVFTDFMTGALWRLSPKGKLKRRATIDGSPADLAYAPPLKRLLIPLLGGGHLLTRKP